MGQHLLLTIRLHDARYHGAPASEWPPSPARVFQALVAGAARGQALSESVTTALEWLEALPPPVIAAPPARPGSLVELYVPNNDTDAVGGDPARAIRTKKLVRPQLLEGDAPLVYAWPLPSEAPRAASIAALADDLYQLGRGVDMAWAIGEVIDDDALTTRLSQHPGTLHRPEGYEGRNALPCPTRGSLASLVRRHGWSRLRPDGEARESTARLLYANAPKPRFVPIHYAPSRDRIVFELRDRVRPTNLWPWPLSRALALIERLRNDAAERLRDAMPAATDTIERVIIGRKADGRDAGPQDERVRIVPLASIGHEHVDPAIRRVLLDVPSRCPLRAGDVAWAFEGLEPADPETGVVGPYVLMRAAELDMLERYEAHAARWQSITPLVLPASAGRRRIDPTRRREQAKGAAERGDEQARATAAVRTALRHAGVTAELVEVTAQREPFGARGRRADDFARGTRFPKERLWHVDVLLARRIEGPLVLGDGRFLGLGVMQPAPESHDIMAFQIDGTLTHDTIRLCRAMRRAVMARAQAVLGSRPLSPFFSGHDENGSALRTERSGHLGFQYDPTHQRLLVLAPHVMDHREPAPDEARHLALLADALEDMIELRVGGAHRYALVRRRDANAGHQRTRTRVWTSASPYTVTRHHAEGSAELALITDVVIECARRGIPKPSVTVLDLRGAPGRGLEGHLTLDFDVAVPGPVILGRSRYLGGGWFVPAVGSDASVAVPTPR